MSKVPRIKIEMSLDGKIVDAGILADTLEDRDTALLRLRTLLPIFEMVSATSNERAQTLQDVIAAALKF